MKTPYKFKIDDDRFNITKYIYHLVPQLTKITYNGYHLDDNNNKIKIDFTLPVGSTSFTYKDVEMSYDINESEKTHGLNSDTARHREHFLTIFCLSKSDAIKIFSEFILDVVKFNKDHEEGFVTLKIYKATCGWMFMSHLPKRKMDTLYLEKDKKTEIIQDLETFYQSAADYRKFSIPYTRKYLFSGPPGVGKTSFIFALASMMEKDIHMINFNSQLDDGELINAISHLDEDSMLVLEDIDALFDECKNSVKSGISFSGLLNTLDGFGRKEKMVVFMTTNHLDKLQDALIRPGRVDCIMRFNVPGKDQVKEMFDHFFPQQGDKFEIFYKKIATKKPSTSLLQKYFFENRNCADIRAKIDELIKLIMFYATKDLTMFC